MAHQCHRLKTKPFPPDLHLAMASRPLKPTAHDALGTASQRLS